MRTKELLLRAILMLMAIAGCQVADAQTLVFHLAGGNTIEVDLDSSFRLTNVGGRSFIAMPDGTTKDFATEDIRIITYNGNGTTLKRGDLNNDEVVDVADIACIIDLMAGHEGGGGSNENNVYTQCPDAKHPHKIDLGLPSGTIWACCNIGALAPENAGEYFAWGETEKKNEYTWGTYSHCDGSYDTVHDLGFNISRTSYDVATTKWNVLWHLPTFDQFRELATNTTPVWVTQNGAKGVKFTGKNGGSIFLPAGGCWWGDAPDGQGANGYYWSATLNMNASYVANFLYLQNNTPCYLIGNQGLAYGLSVRPVTE